VRADTANDRLNVFGGDGFFSFERVQCRSDGAAFGVSHDNDKLGLGRGGGEFDTANLRRRDDISRDSNHEKVSEALIKKNFGRRS
jgi:hypothetical protein